MPLWTKTNWQQRNNNKTNESETDLKLTKLSRSSSNIFHSSCCCCQPIFHCPRASTSFENSTYLLWVGWVMILFLWNIFLDPWWITLCTMRGIFVTQLLWNGHLELDQISNVQVRKNQQEKNSIEESGSYHLTGCPINICSHGTDVTDVSVFVKKGGLKAKYLGIL